MTFIWVLIYILILVVFCLIAFAVFQIKSAGMKVQDFWSFIKANETLDKLYKFSKKYEKLSPQEQVIFLSEAEWAIKRRGNNTLVIKGGYNDEPHNHNDVGSFMIVAKNDGIPIADLGVGIYRKETFDPELRYTLLNNASFGHSVPIINGKYQKYKQLKTFI